MATGNTEAIRQFRQRTGLPVMECARLLQEAGGDESIALLAVAEVRPLRPAKEEGRPGCVGSYRHHNGQIAAIVALHCASDGLARSEEFKGLATGIAIQVAANGEDGLADQQWVFDSSRTVDSVIATLEARAKESITIGAVHRISLKA